MKATADSSSRSVPILSADCLFLVASVIAANACFCHFMFGVLCFWLFVFGGYLRQKALIL
jgi:hypothetical protein